MNRRMMAAWCSAAALLLAAGCANQGGGAKGTTASASSSGTSQPGTLLWFQNLQMTSATTGWVVAGSGSTASAAERSLSLARTTDGARTWSAVTPGAAKPMLATSNAAQALDPVDGGHAYLAVTESTSPSLTAVNTTVVFATTDGGQTWTESAPVHAAGAVTEVSFADAMHGWLLMAGGASSNGQQLPWLYRTSDGGKHWSPAAVASPGSGAGGFCQELGLDFISATTGWVTSTCRSGSQLLVSHDGGGTWHPQSLPIPGSTCADGPCFIDGPRFSGGTGFLSVAPGGGTPDPALMTSEDQGKTWRVLSLPTGARAYPQVRFFSPDQGVLVPVGAQDAIGDVFYVTDDGGKTWTPVPQGTHFTQLGSNVEFVSARAGFAWTLGADIKAGRGSTITVTTNSGRTWTTITPKLAG